MMALVRMYLLFITLYAANATGDTLAENPRREVLQSEESNNRLFGVASVAGITSRNGRISSLGGIQFYPGVDSSVKVMNDGNTYFYPSTNEPGDKYATGSIEVYPGSVVVSSSARSGIDQGFKPLQLSISGHHHPMHPRKEFFYQPLPNFFEKSRNYQPIEPWFIRNMFPFNPPKPEDFDAWIYPNFNQIFSTWR